MNRFEIQFSDGKARRRYYVRTFDLPNLLSTDSVHKPLLERVCQGADNG